MLRVRSGKSQKKMAYLLVIEKFQIQKAIFKIYFFTISSTAPS